MATPTISVAPARLNFRLRKGSTLRRTVTWYQDAARTLPVDLTDYDARMQIRDLAGVQLFELTTSNGGLTLGGLAGTITFYISAEDTDEPGADNAEYDLELVAPNEDVLPFLAGSVTFQNQVTV